MWSLGAVNTGGASTLRERGGGTVPRRWGLERSLQAARAQLLFVVALLGGACHDGESSAGGGVTPPGSVVDPGLAPKHGEVVFAVDQDVVVDAAAYPLRVATSLGVADVTTAGTPILCYYPTKTTVAFLVSVGGRVIVPFVARPADLAANEVEVTVERMALGIVAMHPWLLDLEDGVRESFFDAAPSHPNFAFLTASLVDGLAAAPEEIGDPLKNPQTYAGIQALVDDTLEALLPAGPALAPRSSPCGEVERTPSLSFQGGAAGNVVVVNPRAVFYGIEIDPLASGAHLYGLARPRKGFFNLFPPSFLEPTAECFPLAEGQFDLTAQAWGFPPDLFNPGGRGFVANVLYVTWLVVDLAAPIPLPAVEFTALMVQFLDKLVGSGGGPGTLSIFDGLIEELEGVASLGIEKTLKVMAEWIGENWQQIVEWAWETVPEGEGPPPEWLDGTGIFLSGFLSTLADVIKLQDVAAFLLDIPATLLEGPLESCATHASGVVTIDCPEPLSILPEFDYSPDSISVGESVLFDPAESVFVGGPPGPATYEWFFDDFDESLLPDMTTLAQVPVDHIFTQAGIHGVGLRVTIGDVSGYYYENVPVGFLPNLGFEDGTTQWWDVETHTWSVTEPGSVTPGHSAIVSPGLDPIALSLTKVWNGDHALRVEDSGSGCFISSANHSFVVPSGSLSLKFAWAAVLQDPGHPPAFQPYFDVRVYDETTGSDVYAIHHYSGEPGYPWQTTTYLGRVWHYVPWQPITLDLQGLEGHSLRLSAIGADCGYCGHGGYVYLDAAEGQ